MTETIESGNKNVNQSDRAQRCLRAMENELQVLKQDITFREYVGYEMCLNKFKSEYSHFLLKASKIDYPNHQ